MTDKVYLGRIKGTGLIYLDKHRWDCDWYWGFGYLGNKSCHFHIESLINSSGNAYVPDWTDVNHQFSETWLTQDQWWILRDLFTQAYALKEAAEAYQYGGHNTDKAAPYRVINKDRAAQINEDLETVLDNIWELVTEWNAKGL